MPVIKKNYVPRPVLNKIINLSYYFIFFLKIVVLFYGPYFRIYFTMIVGIKLFIQ